MVDFSSIADLVSSAIADESDLPGNILWDPDQILPYNIIKQETNEPAPTGGTLLNAALKASGLGGAPKLFDGLGGDTMTSGLHQMLIPGISESPEDQDDMLLSLYNTLTADGTVWQPENGLQSMMSMKTEEESLMQPKTLHNSQSSSIQRFTTASAVRVQAVSASRVITPAHHGIASHRFVGSREITSSLLKRTPNFGCVTTKSHQVLTAASGVGSPMSGVMVKELSKRYGILSLCFFVVVLMNE